MPVSVTLNPQETKTLQAPVRTIDVGVGSLIVTAGAKTTTVEAEKSYDAKDTPSLALYSPDSAIFQITYSDEG